MYLHENQIDDLPAFLINNTGQRFVSFLIKGTYRPKPVLRVENPTIYRMDAKRISRGFQPMPDRLIQQAIARVNAAEEWDSGIP